MSDDYKGMSDEAAKEYEERQNAPLFKSAREMVPMHQLKAYQESLVCGYRKRDGCKLLTRDKSLYACIYHQTMQAVGTDFFLYYSMINENELYLMSPQQHEALEKRYHYMKKWLDNFPRGAV